MTVVTAVPPSTDDSWRFCLASCPHEVEVGKNKLATQFVPKFDDSDLHLGGQNMNGPIRLPQRSSSKADLRLPFLTVAYNSAVGSIVPLKYWIHPAGYAECFKFDDVDCSVVIYPYPVKIPPSRF